MCIYCIIKVVGDHKDWVEEYVQLGNWRRQLGVHACVSVVYMHIQREWQGIDVKEMIRGS